METIIKLNAGTHVYASGWKKEPYLTSTAVAATARTFARQLGEGGNEAYERRLANGHDVAYTIYGGTWYGGTWYGGTCLIDNRKPANRMAEERKASVEKAICLNNGDKVEIGCEIFTIHIYADNENKPANSDPVRFIGRHESERL